LLPNLPGSNYKSFREEVRAKMTFCFLHHNMEAKIKSPMNAQVIPASLTEGAAKEQVECCFLTMSEHNCVVVIVLKFMLFLLRMILTLSLSISKSQENTLNLLAPESQIQMKGFGG
jgi:hypothetical protein